jgi:hypothetical protein
VLDLDVHQWHRHREPARLLEILFAVEGFREEHDAIRRKTTHDRTWRGIDRLLAEQGARPRQLSTPPR